MSLSSDLTNEMADDVNGGSSSSSNSDYEMITNSDVFGSPVQIVKVADDRSFELDAEALGKILLRPSIRDTPVVVVSIAGDFRKGKSFMLNHFLRYLQSEKSGGEPEWLADSSAPLKGFSWRGGCQRDTTGILMWSEPFLVKTKDDKEVAIILMDTQGAFDSEYTVKDSATVFALSTMTSSIQVFNLMHNLQEDNLQVLEIFLEYGRLALESVHEKPFQKLIFLIRDWSYPYEHDYGFKGGDRLLSKKLEVSEVMPEQLQRVRRKIRECFSEIGCFLMPHPGSKVATSPKFDGRVEDYDEQFLEHLRSFVPSLLEPSKLIVKEIGGRPVTGRELLEYFKVYINMFAGDTMPEPKTMLEATAEANNLTAVASVKEKYVRYMESICGGAQPYMNPAMLEARHLDIKQECLDEFDNTRKMGGAEFSIAYRQKLEAELDQSYESFDLQNKSKNMFGVFGTPLILLIACFLCFMTSRIFDLIGIEKIATTFTTFGTLDLGLLVLYIFGRYTGNYPEIVKFVDRYAEIIWLFAMDNIHAAFREHPAAATMYQVATGTNLNATNTTTGNASLNRTLSNQPTTSLHTKHHPSELHKRNFAS